MFILKISIIHVVFLSILSESIEFHPNSNEINADSGRKKTFDENLKLIRTHNKLYESGKVSYKLGVTPFTHWTSEEFTKFLNKFHFNATQIRNSSLKHVPSSNLTVPNTLDWRLSGAVSEVKNQGHCGSCWSFSAVKMHQISNISLSFPKNIQTGALEGQAKLVLGKFMVLSEQNLIDCSNEDYGNYGCDGGNLDGAFSYVMDHGIDSEENYPYVSRNGDCKQKSAILHTNGYHYVDNNEKALRQAVAEVGPVSVAMEATEELQNYIGGVFFDRTCTENLNHAILAVGYGEENGKEYWLLKNSWGSWWGEQGYLKLARNQFDNCGISQMGMYPTVKNPQ